ncbi:hypothetical protein LWI28_003585 [Acer negundo]|uniref:Myb/SANT-like domain-containing protein n=1 Tax=Acer negundo TaxID=4023 RepID=A0AAD5NVN8_ACENE|nr:hypothetical protein LWI28_003585 [Acer negundo]
MLLQLMVDTASRGWRDANGMLSKAIVESRIFLVLNEKLGCYISRLKFFKREYQKYYQLLRHSSGFGWDETTKKFTAPEEVWEDYFKSHPTHRGLRNKNCDDYEDLQIVIGNATTTGKNSLGLGDETDARTFAVRLYNVSIKHVWSELEEDEIEGEEIDKEETDGENMDVKEFEEDDEFYEIIRHLLMAIQAVVHVLNEFMIVMSEQHVERPLTRRQITTKGLNNIHNVLNQDPEHFRQRYIMYLDVFRKLCSILREKTLLQNTKFICVKEMLATFLLIVGHNNRYCLVRDTFGRSHFTASINFNKVLKVLNTVAPDMLAKPGSLPSKLKESTRFYPYFKDIGGKGRNPANEIELFNLRHASLRNVIERIFGLHNVLRKECRSDEFSVEQDNEVDPESVNEVDPKPVFQTMIMCVRFVSRNDNIAADFLAKQGAANSLVQVAWARHGLG